MSKSNAKQARRVIALTESSRDEQEMVYTVRAAEHDLTPANTLRRLVRLGYETWKTQRAAITAVRPAAAAPRVATSNEII